MTESKMPAGERTLTVPNALTAARFVAAVVAGGLFAFSDARVAPVALCCLGMTLDALDGWWARRFEEHSRLGAFLDPVADKVLMAVVYGALVAHSGSAVNWALYALITARDLLVTQSRARCLQQDAISSSDSYGKAKMILQSVAGTGMMVYVFVRGGSLPAGLLTAVLGSVVTLSAFSARGHWVPFIHPNMQRKPEQSRN